jgi:DNA-binding MarR family transcriptional regulator
VKGLELFLLGRRLMKLGERAVSSGRFRGLPTSVQSVLVDLFEHPDTAISDIVLRTGLPQSHVSASVARLREVGVIETRTDPNDRRRTLVRPARGLRERVQRRGTAAIDPVLAEALGTVDEREIEEVKRLLEELARRLMRADRRKKVRT